MAKKKVLIIRFKTFFMAGMEGFEPPNAWTKTRCLTTWPHPNAELVYHVFAPVNNELFLTVGLTAIQSIATCNHSIDRFFRNVAELFFVVI